MSTEFSLKPFAYGINGIDTKNRPFFDLEQVLKNLLTVEKRLY